jgi:hypothetical protein
VGTKARNPISNLSLFDFKQPQGGALGALAADNNIILTPFLKVDALSCYTQKIIPATPLQNYIYMITPFSIFMLRVDDYVSKRVRITQITTSPAGNAIKEYFSKDANKQFCFE